MALFMDPFRNWPEGLFMYLQVDSPKEKVAINLAEIRLRIPGRPEVLTPAFISRYERGKDAASWKDVCGRPPGNHESVQALQQVAGEQAQFVVRFDVLDREVNACELEIRAVRVGDEDVMIPPLRYERSTSWFYAPFLIPHGGPMLGFLVFGGRVFFPPAALRPSASP
jgi:hypothetical protein